MTLCITSNHDIASMEKWVVDKFSPVKNTEVVLPNLGDPAPYSPQELGKLIKYVPVKDKDVMTLWYVLPYYELHHKS